MKRVFSLIYIILSSVSLFAQTQDDAMYVYRNDGAFNAFLREDIDSITLSNFDIDSVLHDRPVCQVFHTPDSIYRIPIEAIDSVSFVQPETKYAPGVILLDEQYLPYIVDATDNNITFSSSTPSELLPKKGDVLAAMVFEGMLSNGFAGRVVSVNQDTAGLTCLCEGVNITDIYERLIYVGSVKSNSNDSDTPNKVKRITANGSHSFNLGDIKGNLGPLWVSVTPIWTLSYVLFIEPKEEPIVSLILFQDYIGRYGLDCKLDAGTNGHNIHWLPGEIRLNTPVAGLYGSVNWGLFYSATASAQLTWSQDFNIKWNYGFSQNGLNHQHINTVFPKMGDPSLSISVNGEVNAGICVSFTLGFISNKIASIFANAYLGGYASAQFDAKALIGQYDTAYKGLKESKVDVGIYAAGYPGYRLWFEKDKEIPVGLDYHKPLKSWFLLPDFTAPKIEKGYNKETTIVKSSPSNDLVMPVQLGIGIEDENGEVVETKWCDEDYRREKDWPSNALWQQFDGLKSGKTYTAYPYVRILGHELKASPETEFSTTNLVDIDTVIVTKASYYPNHYPYNNQQYSFKYFCKTVAKLNSKENVEEWGYLYEDPDGRYAKIPLTAYGDFYIDERYAYCRNESESKIRLIGYVKYYDDNQYYFDQPREFDIKYPEETSVTLTDCQYQGTTNNASYQGKTYKYKSTYKFYFTASGAYWLKVKTKEDGSGWNNWDLNEQSMSPVDGSNVLTVNYYYDDKSFSGDYNVYLSCEDETHSKSFKTRRYASYTHSGTQFTGCTLKGTDATRSAITEEADESIYNTVINVCQKP